VAVVPHAVVATPKLAASLKPTMVKRVAAGKPERLSAKPTKTERGRSTAAPGHTKTTVAATPVKAKPAKKPRPTPAAAAPKVKAKEKTKAKPEQANTLHVRKRKAAPAETHVVAPAHGKSKFAPGQVNEPDPKKGRPEPQG
jgi:hypothetical protein